MSPKLSDRIERLQNEIVNFYNPIASSSSEHPVRRYSAKTISEHTSRVFNNIDIVCSLTGYSSSDRLYASALCHDMGRLMEKPESFEGSEMDWVRYRDSNHSKLSAKDCVNRLKKTDFSKDEISDIFTLVESHEVKMERWTGTETDILRVADRLDRLGKDGVVRLYENRRDLLKSSHEESLCGTVETMEEAHRYLIGLGLPSELSKYVEEKYEESKKVLEQLRNDD
jgi:hypothetical protein